VAYNSHDIESDSNTGPLPHASLATRLEDRSRVRAQDCASAGSAEDESRASAQQQIAGGGQDRGSGGMGIPVSSVASPLLVDRGPAPLKEETKNETLLAKLY
jgi:hypothetical protein